MTGQPERPEDKLERLLSGRRGSPLRPEDGAEFAAMSDTADAMRAAGTRIPAPTRMDAAMSRMLAEVERETMNKTATGGFRAMLAAWWSRPMMRTAMATVAAVTVVGGVGMSAATAMGQADPVRELLRISSSSTIGVELTGTVVSIDGTTIKVDANGDVRTIIVDDSTKITGGDDDALTLDDIVVGGTVEVHGRLFSDNSIQATRFHVEDAGGASPTEAVPTSGVPTETASTPGAEPTSGSTPSAGQTEDADDEGDHEDNSGPGNADDDGDNEEDGGSGSGDDEGANDENSSDDEGDHEDNGDAKDDNSGSGSGDDQSNGGSSDDNPADGSDDDNGSDDRSGSGGSDGSGDGAADNGGSGDGGGDGHE